MEAADPRRRDVAPPGTLVGREQEQASLARLLRQGDVRLLTLTGPGGVGKSRLALALMDALAAEYAGGAALVPLASVADASLVPVAIAQALGVRPGPHDPVEVLLQRHLRDRRMLLVLDNMEHVIDAAGAVAALLMACPRLTVLATSRAPLRIHGEQVVPIAPLPVPGGERRLEVLRSTPAVALFVERTRAVRPEFTLDEATAGAIADIVTRLDGLPLAIELAAVRMRILSPAALLARLESRLALLSGGPDALPPRHRTLRATVAWSYDLLSEPAQALFRRLSVFAGSFTIDGVEAVGHSLPRMSGDEPDATVAVLDALTDLVDQALVGRQPGSDDDRFGMLQTVREYGLELLAASGEGERVRETHAAFFLALAERAEPELTGPDQARWTDLLAAEHDNLRQALGFFVSRRRAEEALRLGAALWPFWTRRGHLREGRAWLERALAIGADVTPATRAKATRRLGNLALDLADLERAEAMYETSLDAVRALADEAEIARALTSLGLVALDRGDLRRATALFEEARQRWDRFGGADERARIRLNLGRTALAGGDLGRARSFLEETATLRQELGDREGLAYTVLFLGEVALADAQLDVAGQLFADAAAAFREQDNSTGLALATHGLGRVAAVRGALEDAVAFCQEALRAWLAQGDRQGMAETLETLGAVAVRAGHAALGARWLAAATAWREMSGVARTLHVQRVVMEHEAAAAQELGRQRFAATTTAGRLLTVEQAADAALAASLGPAPDEKSGGLYHLTRREREVLAQAAAGLTDREIAEKLFLSRRTVQTHISNILSKLDAPSRSAAIARAIREGLI